MIELRLKAIDKSRCRCACRRTNEGMCCAHLQSRCRCRYQRQMQRPGRPCTARPPWRGLSAGLGLQHRGLHKMPDTSISGQVHAGSGNGCLPDFFYVATMETLLQAGSSADRVAAFSRVLLFCLQGCSSSYHLRAALMHDTSTAVSERACALTA